MSNKRKRKEEVGANKKRKVSKKAKITAEEQLETLSEGVEKLEVEIQLDDAAYKQISDKVGSTLKTLTIRPEYQDSSPKILNTALDGVNFPELTSFDTNCQALQALVFRKEKYPKLSRISVESPCAKDLSHVDLDLPELKSLSFDFVTINDTTDFGPSLSRSKKLERVSCYKLWGLGDTNKTHVLRCPKLEDLNLYRSDDVRKISVHSAVLDEINLQACYSIDTVNVYPANGSKYRVNLLNADAPKGNLLSSTRCGEVFGQGSDEDADPMDWFGF